MLEKEAEIPQTDKLEAWDDFLAHEGMPAEPVKEEVPPELRATFEHYFENGDTASSAARQFANARETGVQPEAVHKFARAAGYQTGEDSQFALALAERFGISRAEAQRLIDDAIKNPFSQQVYRKN